MQAPALCSASRSGVGASYGRGNGTASRADGDREGKLPLPQQIRRVVRTRSAGGLVAVASPAGVEAASGSLSVLLANSWLNTSTSFSRTSGGARSRSRLLRH